MRYGVLALIAVIVGVSLLLSGCATMQSKVADHVRPMVAAQELDSAELLDVAIVVFDSNELTDKEISELGLSEEIRRAEERYMPIQLKYTMQRTGYWGAVRVVPAPSKAHLQVRGTIVDSDGERLNLEIEAYDSRNVKWFEKTYSEELRLSEYSGIAPEKKDPFQDVYNTIANDLATHREKLTAEDFRQIQQVSELRAAHDMAPDAFDGHLEVDQDGRFEIVRLPAESDPMLQRVRAIQLRDDMMVDTINSYYEVYYDDLWQPYSDWRKLYNEELVAMKEIKKQALTRQLLGLAAIVGGVAMSTNSNTSSSGLPGVMVVGGAAAIYSGFQKSQEARIHRDVIEELSISFTSEAEPLVVEVVGETVRLTGTAEEQYKQWRQMLREIYASETGFPVAPQNSDMEATSNQPAEVM